MSSVQNYLKLINNEMAATLTNYEKWGKEELINYIFSIENGRYYNRYLNEVTRVNCIAETITKENILGKHLKTITKQDLKQWGINDYQDRIDLHNYITCLTQNKINIDKNDDVVLQEKK